MSWPDAFAVGIGSIGFFALLVFIVWWSGRPEPETPPAELSPNYVVETATIPAAPLESFTRTQLRRAARKLGIPRGRDKSDVLANLRKHNITSADVIDAICTP